MKQHSGSPFEGREGKEARIESSSQDWIACRSSGLEILFSRLLKSEKPILLDIGAVSGSSIQYLASLGCKVYADDILDLGFSGNLPYESLFFDGILVWEAVDLLDFSTAEKFMDEVERVLKPGGVAFLVTSLRRKDRTEGALKFRINDRDAFEYSYHEDMILKKYFYSNRDLMKVLSRFEIISFNLLKTGEREIVIQKRKKYLDHSGG